MDNTPQQEARERAMKSAKEIVNRIQDRMVTREGIKEIILRETGLEELIKECDHLRAEVEVLMADKERLDWLDKYLCDVRYAPSSTPSFCVVPRPYDTEFEGTNLRQAIDAARKDQP